MKKTNKKGFTLVELLVVIAIIAILSVVSIVGYTSFTKRAKESNAMTELSQVTTYMYAASAIADSGITLNKDQDGFVVEIGTQSLDETPLQKALYVIRAAIDDTNAREKVYLLSGDGEASHVSGKNFVTVKTLYYAYADSIVAKWEVNGNKLSIDKTESPTYISSPVAPAVGA